MEKLIPFAEMAKLFPEVSASALKTWVLNGEIPHTNSYDDGRGKVRFFSPSDIAAISIYVGKRLTARRLYRKRR